MWILYQNNLEEIQIYPLKHSNILYQIYFMIYS